MKESFLLKQLKQFQDIELQIYLNKESNEDEILSLSSVISDWNGSIGIPKIKTISNVWKAILKWKKLIQNKNLWKQLIFWLGNLFLFL